jgi:hypothetical protein
MAAETYQTRDAWKLWATNLPGSLLNAEDTSLDSVISEILEAASRQIDGDCGRVFYLETEARLFRVDDTRAVRFVDLVVTDDTEVLIDLNGDDTVETELLASQYRLLPLTNARGQVSARYDRLVARPQSGRSLVPGQLVQITSDWGCVGTDGHAPGDIVMACNLRALRLFARRETPLGAVAVPTMGMVGMIRGKDQDYQDLIRPWVINDEEPQYAVT